MGSFDLFASICIWLGNGGRWVNFARFNLLTTKVVLINKCCEIVLILKAFCQTHSLVNLVHDDLTLVGSQRHLTLSSGALVLGDCILNRLTLLFRQSQVCLCLGNASNVFVADAVQVVHQRADGLLGCAQRLLGFDQLGDKRTVVGGQSVAASL